MQRGPVPRRQFLALASAGFGMPTVNLGSARSQARGAAIPALLGGSPVRRKAFPKWPVWDQADEDRILPVLRSGVWSRDKVVREAEERLCSLMGSSRCVTTTNGTNALITSVHALEIGAGDEVITTPYTFVATIHPILLANALPVFVDIDPVTWQIDPARIEEKITSSSKAILPVHITGGVCQMNRILEIARKRGLKIIEDACEAHLAEWRGKKVGTFGDLGCFSFQNGKSLTCGEGGAILGDDGHLMDRCYAFHNLGRPIGSFMPATEGHPIVASKCRLSEFQASILISQMEHVEEQTRRRHQNATYLSSRIEEIPGIVPRADYPEVTLPAYYYFGFRYQSDAFDGLPRERFLEALAAEGIPCSSGLGVITRGLPMHREKVLDSALQSRSFQKIYSKKRLARYREQLDCPLTDRLCGETAGFHGRLLLGTSADMDDIADSILKIYENRDSLRRT